MRSGIPVYDALKVPQLKKIASALGVSTSGRKADIIDRIHDRQATFARMRSGEVTARYLVGDVFDRLAEIPDGTVDLVLTSPPFLALRSYLPADHPDKAREIGSEATPAEFLDTLIALTAEWRRVLAPHGSICVELGDKYSGSGGGGGDYHDGSARRGAGRVTLADGRTIQPNGILNGLARVGDGWPLDRSLTGIPTLYAWSLAYGRNLLTGEPSPAGQWRIRNVVAWVRPNPPVGALGDKFRPATSYLTIATRARNRYFDLDAVRTPFAYGDKGGGSGHTKDGVDPREKDGPRRRVAERRMTHAGAPPLDWWQIPTQPYKGAHYATWPERLCTRPILAMSPQRVCTTCGEPSRRIVSVDRTYRREAKLPQSGRNVSRNDGGAGPFNHDETRTTVGWSDCGHGTWRPGHVLDPFAGSGTTLAVAAGHGRNATGIDLDERNVSLARERVGPYMKVIADGKVEVVVE